MSKRLFGTDGIRGVANDLLTPELALNLGRAAGSVLLETEASRKIAIGRDTRRSGAMLSSAIAAGFASVGFAVDDLGVVPTPVLSFATRTADYAAGVVVSASHNPAPDNGIKFFGANGRKMADEIEKEIEARLGNDLARPTGEGIGEVRSDRTIVHEYENFLLSLLPSGLGGMRVAVDAAHGAAFHIAPKVLRALGAEVGVIGIAPDGININRQCGATHPEAIQNLTQATKADVGVAFDGDADRAIFSDRQGRLVNGDRTLAIWASARQSQGLLDPPIVVGTVMSNGGFEAYLAGLGIRLERTPVGDKYVSARISETGAKVGGEQSGHLVFPDRGPSGDGLVTMLELLGAIHASGQSLEALYDRFENWPQLLVNVTVADRATWVEGSGVQAALQEAEEALQGHGRLNVRASGTQPMVRVMVEADDADLRDRVAGSVVAALESGAGGKVYSRVDLTHSLGE